MTKELDAAVNPDGDLFTFVCPRGGGCGDGSAPFTSTGWDTKKAAAARGRAHLSEHDGDGPMPELVEFRNNQARS